MWDLFKKTLSRWVGENSFEHAAALSYVTLFSMAPILIILIALSAVFFGQEAVEGRVFYEIRNLIGPEGAATLQDLIRKATFEKKGLATIVGVALSPEYVYAIRPGAIFPDKKQFGIFWMSRRALASAFDMEGGFNHVSIATVRGANDDEVIAGLDH